MNHKELQYKLNFIAKVVLQDVLLTDCRNSSLIPPSPKPYGCAHFLMRENSLKNVYPWKMLCEMYESLTLGP